METRPSFSRSSIAPSLLGVSLFLMILAILVGALASYNSNRYFSELWKYLALQSTLENQVGQDLRQMQIAELKAAFNADYELPQDSSLEDAARYADQVQAGLQQFGEQAPAQEILRILAEHRPAFSKAIQIYESGDEEQATLQMEIVTSQNEDMQAALQELAFSIDAERNQKEQSFPSSISQALYGSGLAVVLMILLALVGYRSIGRLVDPLLELTNAVVAIGGDRYHPGLLENVLHKRSPAGGMARGLEAFARSIEQRDASLKARVEQLRQQFYEARRRRLKVAQADQPEER